MNETAMIRFDPAQALQLYDVAEKLFASGLYPNVKNPSGAFAIVQYGIELGITPMIALQNINIIGGKPASSAQLMMGLAMKNGVTFTVKEETATRCEIGFSRNGIEYNSVYTIEDAKTAGLLSKDNWKKYPSDMLYARCTAKGCRRICPEVCAGLYLSEELDNKFETEEPRQGYEKAKNVTPKKEKQEQKNTPTAKKEEQTNQSSSPAPEIIETPKPPDSDDEYMTKFMFALEGAQNEINLRLGQAGMKPFIDKKTYEDTVKLFCKRLAKDKWSREQILNSLNEETKIFATMFSSFLKEGK